MTDYFVNPVGWFRSFLACKNAEWKESVTHIDHLRVNQEYCVNLKSTIKALNENTAEIPDDVPNVLKDVFQACQTSKTCGLQEAGVLTVIQMYKKGWDMVGAEQIGSRPGEVAIFMNSRYHHRSLSMYSPVSLPYAVKIFVGPGHFSEEMSKNFDTTQNLSNSNFIDKKMVAAHYEKLLDSTYDHLKPSYFKK